MRLKTFFYHINKNIYSTRLEERLSNLAIRCTGTSLVVQWLRCHTPNAGGPESIPGLGTRSHMLQLKILHATTKTTVQDWNIMVVKRKKNVINLSLLDKQIQSFTSGNGSGGLCSLSSSTRELPSFQRDLSSSLLLSIC